MTRQSGRQPQFAFRRLEDADLPLLHRWLNEPGIVRWWEGDDVSWDGVVRDYGSANRDPTEHWLACLNGRELGWIQVWALADEPEEAAKWLPYGVRATAAGIDYLIGEPADRGRGRGSAMISAFIDQVVFRMYPQYDQVCAAPYAANVASWRALEKAGFNFRGEIEDRDGPCRLMVCERQRPAAV
ncbi:MAG TPA: GNAT family N-acetyltransferase [Actinomycetota bacterium]|nr:GNAT family N-acetyltransferase [Actinomycetota bacterium]